MIKSKEEASQLEQRTLVISLYAVILAIIANLIYGLYIKSDILILNAIFALMNLAGSGLSLLAAKLVVRPADQNFQYGYWHVEPLVNCFNGLMMLILCLYAFINGVEGMRTGGNKVDADGMVGFSILAVIFCFGMWLYKKNVSRQIESKLLKHDTEKWTIKLSFHLVTLAGFASLPFLPEPQRAVWQNYADTSLVAIMAILLLPIPIRVLKSNIRELMLIAEGDEVLEKLIEKEMQKIQSEYDISAYFTHIAQVGRSHFIKINILIGEHFELQSVKAQDALRERIWRVIDKTDEEGQLSVCITSDKRWFFN